MAQIPRLDLQREVAVGVCRAAQLKGRGGANGGVHGEVGELAVGRLGVHIAASAIADKAGCAPAPSDALPPVNGAHIQRAHAERFGGGECVFGGGIAGCVGRRHIGRDGVGRIWRRRHIGRRVVKRRVVVEILRHLLKALAVEFGFVKGLAAHAVEQRHFRDCEDVFKGDVGAAVVGG